MTAAAVARIRSAALAHNLQRVRELAPASPVLAVVKANAYGHGLLETVAALSNADAFAVARFEAAISLRQAGVTKDIVVLSTVLDAQELAWAREFDLRFVVHSVAQVNSLVAAGEGAPLHVWLKIDTGMGRLGIHPEQFVTVLDQLSSLPYVADDICLMTHLACADEPESDMTARQLATFAATIGDWDGDISVANSAGILAWPEALGGGSLLSSSGRNWARPGLMLYGVSPFADRSASDCGLQPVMTFEGRLLAVRHIPQGHSVGYAADWVASRDTKVGVVNVGYADGYPWRLSNQSTVVVNGRIIPLIGRVSMDMISVDLSEAPEAQVGDTVVLWGEQPTVSELAAKLQTSTYELLTGVGNRVQRIKA